MAKMHDLTGQRFGETTVMAFHGREDNARKRIQWLCRCDCGTEHVARAENLKSGNTSSCGHLHSGGRPVERHGHHASPTYATWEHVVQRCTNPNNDKWDLYGGAGVTVCDRWRDSFVAFLEDMGERPEETSLDRIDPDKGYEPKNCRWATILEQNRNLRTARKVQIGSRVVPLNDLTEAFGQTHSTVRHRLGRGWSVADALLLPKGTRIEQASGGKGDPPPPAG